MGMFDFDGNGHTDIGEQFIGYQIFRDVSEPFAGGKAAGGNAAGGNAGGNPSGEKPAKRRLRMEVDGPTIFGLVVLAYVILKTICG